MTETRILILDGTTLSKLLKKQHTYGFQKIWVAEGITTLKTNINIFQLQKANKILGTRFGTILKTRFKTKPLSQANHMSHEKNPLTFHYTGCLIGILIMAYYNPHITG